MCVSVSVRACESVSECESECESESESELKATNRRVPVVAICWSTSMRWEGMISSVLGVSLKAEWEQGG